MSQLSDPISDFLTRLRNSACAGHRHVNTPYSRIKGDLARILKQEGYIADYSINTEGIGPTLRVTNKYIADKSAITGLKRISKPGLRKYVSVSSIPRILGGMGVALISTSAGVMSGSEARRINSGGELLGAVW